MSTLTVPLWSPCHSLPRKYRGFQPHFPFQSEGRRICNLKHRRAWTNNLENNKIIKLTPSKTYDVIVPSYSADQQQPDSNVPRDGEHNKLMIALIEYCRPYTMIGMVIGVPAISILPLMSLAEVSPAFLIEVLKVIIVFVLGIVYVVGVNQIYDIEIDKINKPNRPMASGALPMGFAVALVLISLLGCMAIAIMYGSPALFIGALIYCLSGSLYSFELPFMRWKKNQFLAILCLVMFHGVAIPFGTFVHIQKYVLGRPILFTRSLIFTSCFGTLFSVVLGLSKDLPDIEGDRLYGMNLLTVRLGQHRVFWICISTLMLIYGCAIGVGASSSFLLSKLVTILGHSVLAFVTLYRALTTDLSIEGSASQFYMFVWKSISSFLLFGEKMRTLAHVQVISTPLQLARQLDSARSTLE